MIKKIFKGILIIIIVLAVGLAAYWYFDRQQGGSGIPLVGNNNLSIGDFFPFGTSGTNTPTTTTPNTNTNDPGTNNNGTQTPLAPPRLWQISTDPQSGVVAFNSSSTPFVRFIDKATGNIFESSLRLLGLQRITNTTIPKVYEAMWQPSGKSLIIRYLDQDNQTIKSTYGTLALNEPIQELRASFLPNDITSLSVNQTTGDLAFIIKDIKGSTIFVTKANTSSPRPIFESAIKDFTVSWVNTTTLSLITKPSADAVGQMYFIKTDSGLLSRVIGYGIGLTALSNPDGTKIFFSESRGHSLESGLFNPKTGEVTTVPFRTISNKCVWSKKSPFLYCATPKTVPSGEYPDAWYQGKISFNDTLWRMNTETGATEFLIDPFVTTEKEFDATNLTLDPNEEYLVFTNKKDSQLWGLLIQRGS